MKSPIIEIMVKYRIPKIPFVFAAQNIIDTADGFNLIDEFIKVEQKALKQMGKFLKRRKNE